MSFEILHFRDSEKLLKVQNMEKDVRLTIEYLDEMLRGTSCRRELTIQALEEMGWRENSEALRILEGRRYRYSGFKNGVALEVNFSSYEFIQLGLFRLQLGFDKGLIQGGIVVITSERSEKSKLGSSRELVSQEIEALYPTISLPVTVVLFDLEKPGQNVDSEIRTE